jgi:hypothetical protein
MTGKRPLDYSLSCSTVLQSGSIVHNSRMCPASMKQCKVWMWRGHKDYVNSRQRSIDENSVRAGLTKCSLNQPTIYHPNSRENRILESHIPIKSKKTATAIRIVLVVPGATARVMRSAEDTRPDARELNVLVFFYETVEGGQPQENHKRAHAQSRRELDSGVPHRHRCRW